MIDAQLQSRIDNYLLSEDDATKKVIAEKISQANAGDEAAMTDLRDSFGRDLDFGTGGLRGIMGVGTNRMNRVNIAKATQGLAQYIVSQKGGDGSVAIAYDSRINSRAFAEEAASVIAGNGLKAYIFQDYRPTPELSFAVRYLKTTAGIVVTASHNPKEYNGYKVSWDDGGQVLPPHDKAIIKEVRSVGSIADVKRVDFETGVKNGSIILLGKDVDDAFIAALDEARLHPELTEKSGDQLSIVYTPLHGTGIRVVPDALARWGFKNIHVVKEQAEPDGNFPTTLSPNPEEKVALELALKLADETGSDIVMATDPDADRLGIAVRHKGEMRLITGNQLCALLVWYVCESYKEKNNFPANPMIVKSIVTTELITEITQDYGVGLDNCLTGFKYIAELMRKYETETPVRNFLMGCEESYGYLVGTHARDKDAVVAACSIAEFALWAKLKGKTLVDILEDLYCRYGVHVESQISKTMKGLAGMEAMQKLMDNLRGNPPTEFAGLKVLTMADISNDTVWDFEAKMKVHGPGLASSNVLLFHLEDGSLVVARPSGTEPKVKFYFMVVDRANLPISKADLPKRIDGCLTKDKKLQDALEGIIASRS